MSNSIDEMKRRVAIYAVDKYIKSDMVIGLGTGSTALHAIKYLSELINSHLYNIKAVATSELTHEIATSLGINVVDIDDVDYIDVAIDGADEIDNKLNLIKGGGGALLREKIVELKAKIFVVIADESKLNKNSLGTKFPIPVEIVKFGYKTICKEIELKTKCSSLKLRYNKDILYETNNKNYIVDVLFKSPCDEPHIISEKLSKIEGVVCNGLFINMADVCIICDKEYNIHTLDKSNVGQFFMRF